MSFRELRNFCEVMRSLGYHRLISVENFRTPNFELVADILDWLLHRFEPNCGISDDISTEARRVEFIKSVCERVLLRTGTKLNTRKLYGADGYAVKELLKLAMVLYDAQKSVNDKSEFSTDESFGLSSKLSDLKSTRSLCSQIVETGAGLFDLLQKEADTRLDREKALRFLDGMSRNLESNSEHEVVERAVMSMLGNHGENLESLKQMSEELQRDEKSLEQKIKKKRQELERCKKRLTSLVNVRPAFMDEYEQLEQQFERYYEQYVGRFRNLDYLEYALDMLNREEKERMEENERALKRMQKRLRDEEWRLLRGEEDEKDGEKRKPKKGAGAKSWMPPAAIGSMDAGDDDDALSDASGSSDPPISVGGSQASEDPPVSLGGSASDDDILNESEEDDDISEGGMGGGGMRGGHGRDMQNDFDF
jgi:clusterin-associated protein 1